MPTTILATKLYVPPPRPKVVMRPRLIERLNQGLAMGCKLTLISASAGFGKTTLVGDWVAGCGLPAAWLSLDEGDSDITRFLMYLVAALRRVSNNIGADVLATLQSPQPPQSESILTALLNEIAIVPETFILIIDDYHVVDARPVDDALVFLLEHMPPQMHLVIATREDPSLPLARLRARGQLTELRAADLRFTSVQAAEFFNQVMGLKLSAEEIAALESRTESWVAGLQLAALSMQGREDIASFLQAFTGSHRFVLDYLIEEVLQRQPFTEDDQFLFEAVSGTIAASIRNADLYRSEHWRRQVADSLREVAGLISEQVGIEQVLNAILKELERNLPVDVSAIWLLGEDRLSVAAVHGTDAASIERMTAASPEVSDALNRTLLSSEPVVHQPTEPFWHGGKVARFPRGYFSLAAPMRVGEQPVGVIALAHHERGRYGHEARAMVATFASYAAVAIANTRLYDAAQERAYVSAALLQVAEVVASPIAIDETLERILRMLPGLLGGGDVQASPAILGRTPSRHQLLAPRGF